MNTRIRVVGIPIWVTYFLMFLILIGLGLGIPALIGQGLMEAQSAGWGGRQLGIAIGSILAVIYRSQIGYLIVFTCHALKEIGDLIDVLSAPEVAVGMVLPFMPFIVLEVAALWLSYRATKTQ